MLCRYCQKVEIERKGDFWPFCSERCKLLDLGAWANEAYRVTGASREVADATPEEDPDETKSRE